ncbi:MAG TPA: methionine--tRNA ligase [Bacilli bacterium]|nr:methionine--tRNA ligase [Bacilli bacterium]
MIKFQSEWNDFMKRDIFIGGAWPYANYYLHVGHLAALLPGDILAKYYRGCGDNVMYVSGSDCHGTPITERAKKEGKNPKEIALFYHEEFVKTFHNMDFEYDEYSATMTDYHKKVVQECFLKLMDNGYIYEKEVPQDYCEKCQAFLSDREIVGICPHCGGKSSGDQCEDCLASLDSNEVLDKHCKACGSKTVLKNNKHLYFKLTAFQDDLQKLLDKNKDIWRKNAVGETQKFLDMGLVDRAATRQLDWGVPVPVPGYEDKRIYVWVEAVLGYFSMGKKVAERRNIDFDKFLANDNQNLRTYYVHGKDNIAFHTVIYPALLKGLENNYRLPDYIISSAYVNLNDEKMSKSKGNLISVDELLTKFDSDTLRFYFTFNGPETKDTTCSIEEMIQVHNKFLVGVLGNFINRNLSFVNKKFEGVIKEGTIDENIIKETKKAYELVGKSIEKGEFRNALNLVIDYISLGNKYYDEKEPWNQIKEDLEAFNNTTYTCVYMINNIANLIHPFIPKASQRIRNILNLPEFKWEETSITGDLRINSNELLFTRIENK